MLFLYLLIGWAGGAAIALIVNHAIHGTDEDD
jgi:hypothetical protein